MQHYAHTLPDREQSEWEPLLDHLHAVADRAADFASAFDARDWGRIAGLWHDIGKFSTEFQNYLRTANGPEAHIEDDETSTSGKVDHSTAGAQLADEKNWPGISRILAYCIAGHHAGLADAFSETGQSGLNDRLAKPIPNFDAAPAEITEQPQPTFPARLVAQIQKDGAAKDAHTAAFRVAMFCRLLFSTLVDADFLATEEFIDRDRAKSRPHITTDFAAMERALDDHLASLGTGKTGTVPECRQEVLDGRGKGEMSL